MTTNGASAAKTLDAIKKLGFTHVLMIPDSESGRLHLAIGGDPSISLITPTREGESMAIAAGLWTGGKKPLVVIQNTGLFEAGDALRGCGLGPKVPLRLMIGWRGYGAAASGTGVTDSAYTYTEPILKGWGIPYWRIMNDGDLSALGQMDQKAEETGMPAAVVTGYAFRE